MAGVVDFVASVSTPTASELAQAPDLLSIPLTVTAIAPGYYVRFPSHAQVCILRRPASYCRVQIPSLYGNVTLNFDLALLAQIYLNQVLTPTLFMP